MFRRLQSLSGKNTHTLPLVIALAGLLCISGLASGLGIAVAGRGGKVDTVLRPQAGPIVAPGSTNVADGETSVDPMQEVAQTTDCDDLLLMVGTDHTLTADYVPPDLVYLGAYGIPTRGSEDMLRQEAAVQLGGLVSDAAADGVEVLVASGYRSYWEQSGTYEWFKDAYGEDAGRLSVPPGQSEHQLGTAVDFASSEADYELVPEFADTSAGQWLFENAARYGFVLSYGEDREADTGVGYEPWHYRYIGVENALEVEAAGGNPAPLYREGASPCYKS